uniref:Uncharacterized protein n=1 Tax=Megaselia scalaris TaxID=36166 RepID=T1GP40_MEGSC
MLKNDYLLDSEAGSDSFRKMDMPFSGLSSSVKNVGIVELKKILENLFGGKYKNRDKNPEISRKALKKVAKEAKEARAAKEKAPVSSDKAIPQVDTAFKTFISARFCSAIWAYISDCDETFNYWEPLHYVIYGRGLQTWEYSPEFALGLILIF